MIIRLVQGAGRVKSIVISTLLSMKKNNCKEKNIGRLENDLIGEEDETVYGIPHRDTTPFPHHREKSKLYLRLSFCNARPATKGRQAHNQNI